MATTSNQIQVSKEAVRLLVIQHGQREAARIAGINENTVRSWAMRYKWSTPTAATKTQPNGHSALVERISDELADNERETKLGLARHTTRAIRAINKSVHPVKYTRQANDVAKTASIAFKWNDKEQSGNTVVNIALLGVDPASVSVDAAPVIDVESGVLE